MTKNLYWMFAVVCAFTIVAALAAPAGAQMSEVKEKPPMYSYVGFWNIPRAQWGEMDKSDAADQKILQQALANGSIVAYGNDRELIHQPDGSTHDDWWSSMSMAGVLNVLDQFYKAGNSTTPVLASATKHWDSILVSRYYNWHAGSWKDAYSTASCFKLKDNAPDDALDTLSKTVFVPFMEKMLAEGNIHEYEIDTQAYHTEPVGRFCLIEIDANAEAIDKINAALQQMLKSNATFGPTFESMVDWTGHHDDLTRTSATYK